MHVHGEGRTREMPDRVPPQNLEAEQSVLGAVLLDRDAAERCVEILHPEDLYREAHRRIFDAVTTLVGRREAVDVITVAEELGRAGQLEAVGGLTYLSDLTAAVPTTANAAQYARIVADKAMLRQLLRAAAEITDAVFGSDEDPDAVLDEAESRIFGIAESRRSGRSFQALKDVLMRAFASLEQLYEHKGEVIGTPTGLSELDRITTGFHPAELIVLAARPSQGKTALALNIAVAAAFHGTPVGFFSLEMGAEQLAMRLLCMVAKVASERVRTGFLGEEDWPKLGQALGRLADTQIFIDDTPNMSLMDLRARARRMRAECEVSLVIVDYLQLMHTRGRFESRQQEIAEISRSLKALARELEVPVLALSQLSRAVESRETRRPQLSDLRESGAIEQDADVVIFIYQDPKLADDPSRRYEMELIVAKQRNGPTGPVPVVFQRQLGLFTDKPTRAG